LRNISIRTGLLIQMLFMAILLLCVSVLGVVALKQSNHSLNDINRIQGSQLGNLASSNTNIQRVRVAASLANRHFEMHQNDQGVAAVGRSAGYATAASNDMQHFLHSTHDSGQAEQLARELSQAYQTYMEQGIEPMLNALRKQDSAEYYSIVENTLPGLGTQFDNANRAFFNYAQQTGLAKIDNTNQQKDLMVGLIYLCCIFALLQIVVAWFVLNKILIMPLHVIGKHMAYVAKGDLTHPIHDAGKNEIGRLNQIIAAMQQSLGISVKRVREACKQIDAGTHNLATGNDDLAHRTEMSTTSLEQTVASMQQLTRTVKNTAQNAHHGQSLAKKVSEIASVAKQVVDDMTSKMVEISRSAENIGHILSVIDDIAFQTNILALNASVEAARAGEQGRGFAVVANEVRTLAQRSAQAAKEISGLIADSQTHVKQGDELAGKANGTINTIDLEIAKMTQLINEISIASSEQSRGIDQVNQAIEQMDNVAQQNTVLVKQSASATRVLEEQSQQLMLAMSTFHI
jgi:methyl-accepting chemotaxis protein-1 (serine sensor receptor)